MDITLGQLSGNMWYAQSILVQDEKHTIIYAGYNWKLQDESCKHLHSRRVASFGVINGVIVIFIK